MTQPRWAVAALAGGLVACGQLPTSPTFDGLEYFPMSGYGAPQRPAVFTMEPTVLPSRLAIGERVGVRILLTAEPADHHAEFLSASPHVRWIVPNPPCPRNFCAELEGVSVSPPSEEVCVTILICPPGFTSYCPAGPRHCLTVVDR